MPRKLLRKSLSKNMEEYENINQAQILEPRNDFISTDLMVEENILDLQNEEDFLFTLFGFPLYLMSPPLLALASIDSEAKIPMSAPLLTRTVTFSLSKSYALMLLPLVALLS